jgi:acetyl esterase/lipase
MRFIGVRAFLLLLFAASFVGSAAADEPGFTRKQDVIYGRKFGTALTMDVFTPSKDANGAAVIFAVSGGWFSSHDFIDAPFIRSFPIALAKRGYTVFAVVHGSQPRYTIPNILEDMHRAVRYVRYHAKDYQIDPDRFGITGASAGGHLSLMQGVGGKAGDPKATDPVDRSSSRVQAVACFFPPTDFFNYGKPGEDALGRGILKAFKAPFDFQDFDRKTNSFVLITDEARRHEIGVEISPAYHVTKAMPPTLIIHGDADKLVPIQQAQLVIDKLKEVGVPAQLVTKPGAQHGWLGIEKDMQTIGDWFDKYLNRKLVQPQPQKAKAARPQE